MEKDGYFGGTGNWQPESNNINSFFNLNWAQSLSSADQAANFESALSSLVSSPTSSSAAADSVVIRELIGRIGSICSNTSGGGGGEISPPSSHYQSANTSCYNTPLNSPPKLNLSIIDNQNRQQLGRAIGAPNHFDPRFAERGAAKYSCFGPEHEHGKLSRASSSQSLKAGALNLSELGKDSPMQEEANEAMLMMMRSSWERGSAQDEPSASDRMAASASKGNVKKRKTAAVSSKGGGVKDNSAKMIKEENSNAKRSKPASSDGAQMDGDEKEKENNVKAVEPPKDYIHVRARRGQATDSHSLAERVRREKISERMKFLQDLVPGCDKITGKAVMLDEIINYVQSLQRQVEFLSMKLATVNPHLDFNPDNLLIKDTQQPHLSFPLEAASSEFSYANQLLGHLQGLVENGIEPQCSVNPLLDANLHRSLSMTAASQLGVLWEDDLHSVVQMGFGQNQEAIFSSHNFQGSLPSDHMKIEL